MIVIIGYKDQASKAEVGNIFTYASHIYLSTFH